MFLRSNLIKKLTEIQLVIFIHDFENIEALNYIIDKIKSLTNCCLKKSENPLCQNIYKLNVMMKMDTIR